MPHSVFCNDDHISLLAEYAARYDLGGMVGLDEGPRAAQTIGEALHRANCASVNFDCAFTDEREYTHNRGVVADQALNAPMQILKAAQFLARQSDGHPEWDKSGAKRVLDRVIVHAIRRLPGYEEA
jgi:hypothetical protein